MNIKITKKVIKTFCQAIIVLTVLFSIIYAYRMVPKDYHQIIPLVAVASGLWLGELWATIDDKIR